MHEDSSLSAVDQRQQDELSPLCRESAGIVLAEPCEGTGGTAGSPPSTQNPEQKYTIFFTTYLTDFILLPGWPA